MTNPKNHLPESPTRAQALHLLLALQPSVIAKRLADFGHFSPDDTAHLLGTPKRELPDFFTIPEDYFREARLHELDLYEHETAQSTVEAALIRHVVAQSVLRAARQHAGAHYESLKRTQAQPRLLEDHWAFEAEMSDARDALNQHDADLDDADKLARDELLTLLKGEYLPLRVPILLRAEDSQGNSVRVTVDPEAQRLLSF